VTAFIAQPEVGSRSDLFERTSRNSPLIFLLPGIVADLHELKLQRRAATVEYKDAH
jgi:hypothetical protein